jgi:Fe-S cluster biogenesis protein NfuA/nitrite reductase/ring-hydroxylating ferredoxin subunit
VDDAEARARAQRIDELLAQIEELGGHAHEVATELVQALVDLYGEGLARMVARFDGRAASLADDEVVAHLLLLHGLHPVPLERRVSGALDEVAPYLRSHGGGVELLGVVDGVVRLRLQGSCNGCPSSRTTLELAIEEAIHKAAPDVERIEAEGAPSTAPPPLLQIETRAPAGHAWAAAGSMRDLPDSAPVLRDVEGAELLFVRLGRGAYAYRPECPRCGASLSGARLTGPRLACGQCGSRYDVRHAGRCLDADDVHMDPVPLLADESGAVRVALGAPA